jgi:DNA repair protein RadC
MDTIIEKSIQDFTDSEIAFEYKRRFSVCENKPVMQNSRAVKEHLRIMFGNLEQDREHFICVFLDGQNKIIRSEVLFTGSLTTSAVYPREVVKKVLQYEAGAVIFGHNHPSGSLTPSSSDRAVTKKLQTACGSIDVEVLDHIIIAGEGSFSFADHRLI